MAEKQQRNLFAAQQALPPWEADAQDDRLVATVVFSEGVDGEFDYLVPDHLRSQLEPGRRVAVPFGKGNRVVTGYCVAAGTKTGVPAHRLKTLQRVIDDVTLISPGMLRLTQWLADYYLCSWGKAIETAVPSGVRGLAGTREAIFLSVSPATRQRAMQSKLSPKQRAALEHLEAVGEPLTPQQLAQAVGCTQGPILQLRKRGLVELSTRRVVCGTVTVRPTDRDEPWHPHADQQHALARVQAALESREARTLLIHGVTGSGKTEVYIRAIEQVVKFGRQAIVLVPEISLTPQTEQRFRSRFESVAVLHSHQSAVERHWQWRRIVRGEAMVVVGARSAVFAPTPHLGLIILDEEHDSSFKQDSTPRYHARDVALERCRMERVPLILGSATPSLESYHAAITHKYELITMPRRVFDRPLPHVAVIDLRNEFASRRDRGAISRPLQQAMQHALREGGQVILLLNRRGFATSIQCPACGHVVKCINCDIGLTHHQAVDLAVCHYCDRQIPTPPVCPKCEFENIRFRGLGTQRLEAEVRRQFPDAPCLRMDSDTMQKPGSHEAAFAKFRSGEIKILLGTQMIAKGLDFPNVTLVGVVNADMALHFPNFRAGERTFQLVTQVAGRTGRGERGGRVMVQTFSPDHPAIMAAMRHDYTSFAEQELPSRERYGYPPYNNMVRVIFRGDDAARTDAFAHQWATLLAPALVDTGARLVGPAQAPISKIQSKYRYHLLLLGPHREELRSALETAISSVTTPDDVQWVVDVDPVDML